MNGYAKREREREIMTMMVIVKMSYSNDIGKDYDDFDNNNKRN